MPPTPEEIAEWLRPEIVESVDVDATSADLDAHLSGARDDGGCRLIVNPNPLVIRAIPECRRCRMRAPWCKCGAMDYTTPEADDIGQGGRRDTGVDPGARGPSVHRGGRDRDDDPVLAEEA